MAKQTDSALAAQLIGTKNLPEGLQKLKEAAERAHAYHCLRPYPRFGFTTWKTEDLGPLPECRALPKRAVRRGARFLFGKGIEIKVAGNEALEEQLREWWVQNHMPARCVAMAEKGAIEGGVCLKFAYDPESVPALSIQTLSLVDQVRLFYHPHDRTRLLMARVQYLYYDAITGASSWYREDWTAEDLVVYEPIRADVIGKNGNPDTYDKWIKDAEASGPNPFKLIPIVPIKNIETDDLYGVGDMWEYFRLIDDLNLVWYQMRRSNQFDSELNPYFIDADLDDEDIDKPVQPGQPIDLKSTDTGEKGNQAKVVFPSGGNGLRTAMMEYARELRREIEEAAGTVSLDPASITNMGQLSQAVLTQLYTVLLETTAEKQKSYGQDGIEPFLETVARGLQNHGVPLGVKDGDIDTYSVEIAWPAPFALTPDEKTKEVGRIQEEQVGGYITHDRAVEAIAQVEGIRDVAALKDELAKEPKPSPTETDPALSGGQQEAGNA